MNRNFHALAVLLAATLAGCQAMGPRPVQTITPAEVAPPARDLPAAELTPDVLFQLLVGEIAGHRGDFGVSVGALGRAAQKTRDPRLAERAALAALYSRQPKEALANASLWAELRPASIEAHEALAAALMESGQNDQAVGEFERMLVLAGPGGLPQAYLRISATLGRQADRSAALATMQRLVALRPDQAVAHYALAHLAVRVGDLDSAMTAIDRALALNPSWEDAALFKARVLVSRKDMNQVLRYYEDYLDDYPRANGMRLGYARLLVDLKQWNRAREQFKRVVAASPQDADAAFTVALLAMQVDDLGEAEKYLLRTIELQPDNDQARLYLGQLAEQRKRYDDAIQWYGEIESDEYRFEAQTRLGVVLANQGRLEQARAHLQALVPGSEAQRVQVALAEEQILRDARRFKEGFDVLTAALGELPNNTDLLYARALVAEKLDRVDVAEKDLRRILKRDPKNANALNALGYTLADRTTRYKEALGFIEQALALKPDDPFILDSMGWVMFRLGQPKVALMHLEDAYRQRPDPEIAAHMGEVLWSLGRRDEARKLWAEARLRHPDNEVLGAVIEKFQP